MICDAMPGAAKWHYWEWKTSGKRICIVNLKSSVADGKISELFYAPYEGEHMFRLDEGNKTSAWIRFGDNAWYAIGRSAKVECAKFRVSEPIGDMLIVTRIWIGK
jgi:hypothetical protein